MQKSIKVRRVSVPESNNGVESLENGCSIVIPIGKFDGHITFGTNAITILQSKEDREDKSTTSGIVLSEKSRF